MFEYFTNLFKSSLPDEIHIKINFLRRYLSTLKEDVHNHYPSCDKLILSKLKITLEWKNYQDLFNFNAIKFFNRLEKTTKMLNNFNFFNKEMYINLNINNEEDLLNYLKITKKYFKKVCESFRYKVFTSAKQSIRNNRDINIHYDDFEEVNYDDYLLRYLKCIEKIEYLPFYGTK